MDIKSARKRIKKAVKELNALNSNLEFSFVEKAYGIFLECCSTAREGARFGAYENAQFFEDYVKKVTAYINLMEFAELIITASKLNDPKAYHNFIAA